MATTARLTFVTAGTSRGTLSQTDLQNGAGPGLAKHV